ncbi:MAG: linear amide C-N hydrolase [Paramuribaculum sp.]|nr:linear amide C-N hydrolase [Paramuribaculum sp.]
MNLLRTLGAALTLGAAMLIPTHSDACSRVVYIGSDSTLLVVGRSLDWKTPIPTNLYVYPKGMAKKGNTLPGSVEWVSKYGAVYAVGYDGGVTEGMNEKGLSVNGLFCKGTVYVNEQTENRAPMSLSLLQI